MHTPHTTQWQTIKDYPDYSISFWGQVRNDRSGRNLALLRNQHGITNVGLMRDGKQHKKSVAILVAEAFVDLPENETFDTPIHLDGDRSNNYYTNLLWRPLWFARKFHSQFDYRYSKIYNRPVEEVTSGELFESPWDAVTKYGVLHREIWLSVSTGASVWPTYQKYREPQNRYLAA